MRKRAWAVVALFQCRLTRAQAGLASCEKALGEGLVVNILLYNELCTTW